MYTGALIGGFVLVMLLGGCQMPYGGKVSAKALGQGVELDVNGRPVPVVVEAVEGHVVERLIKVHGDNPSLLCDEFDKAGVELGNPRVYDDYCSVKPPVAPIKGVECPVPTVAPSCDGMLSHDAVDALHADYMGDIRGKANRIEELEGKVKELEGELAGGKAFEDALRGLCEVKGDVVCPLNDTKVRREVRDVLLGRFE